MFQNLQRQINAIAQGGGVVPPELIAQVNGNSSNIGVLQTDVGTLNGQVSGNTSNITALNTSVGTLSTDVATNTSNIGVLQTDVATNTSNIVTNTTDIATNTSNIVTLQGQVTALENRPCGQWHKSSNQTINTFGTPSTVPITWNSSSAWTDTALISHNGAGNANFTVNTRGIYRIDLQLTYLNFSTATFTDRSIRPYITLTRGGTSQIISQSQLDSADNTPNTVGVSTGILFELKVGDVLFFQTSQYLSLGSFILQGQTSAPNDWDLNTFWSWELVRSL